MQRATRLESNRRPDGDREAAAAASRSTPLDIVSGAIAGDDLQRVARNASEALDRPVAIVLPVMGGTVIFPPGAFSPLQERAIVDYAGATVSGRAGQLPAPIAYAVPIRIGPELVGIVATAKAPNGSPAEARAAETPAWLEAAATAAAVTALMRETRAGNAEESRRALLRALSIGPPADVMALVAHARRLGVDISAGAVALAAHPLPDTDTERMDQIARTRSVLLSDLGDGRIVALVAAPAASGETTGAIASELEACGLQLAVSGHRRDPAALHEALREAELLLELSTLAGASLRGQEETYRLLIGVLLRNPEELASLRDRTISPLAAYDAEHDTELLATLETFLAHDGSTTETAEVMNLHRHTVGYRLTRVQEVSQLSPYESEGRERLGLGLKAHQIIEAANRCSERLSRAW